MINYGCIKAYFLHVLLFGKVGFILTRFMVHLIWDSSAAALSDEITVCNVTLTTMYFLKGVEHITTEVYLLH